MTISQRGDRFFASFSIKISQEEFDRTHKAAVQNKTAVGIDLGLKSALVLSDGMAIKAPKPLKKSLLRLKRLQRQLNRKNHPRTKGDDTKVSKNYIKQSKRLNKLLYRERRSVKQIIKKTYKIILLYMQSDNSMNLRKFIYKQGCFLRQKNNVGTLLRCCG